MLELLAEVGRPEALRDVRAMMDSSLEEVGPVLAELVEARIVFEVQRGGEVSYVLQHPLVRDVIYQATNGARRRVLHRQAARCLLGGGHLAEAALHFAHSADRGDSEAVEVLLDAMRQAERREAYREALELQAELVELLPIGDQRWLEVLEAMYARAEWLIDHRAETDAPVPVKALRAIDELLEGASEHGRRAIVKFRLANFLAWGMGELEQANEACRQAHELFIRSGEERQALLAARELAWIKGLRGDLVGMGADARAVVQAADAVGDRFVAMQGLSAVSYSANFCGLLSEGEAVLRRAATIARQDDKDYRLTVVLGRLAAGLALQGRVAETAAIFEDAKGSNPADRDCVLVELEALVRWIAGDFPASVAAVPDSHAKLPNGVDGAVELAVARPYARKARHAGHRRPAARTQHRLRR
jgi:tetratricopeptide (TPR) repeat protein